MSEYPSRIVTGRETIINLLSEEISNVMQQCASERTYPARSSDNSDDFIRETREKVIALREIRERLEVIFNGEIE
jgi:hypothetical protein